MFAPERERDTNRDGSVPVVDLFVNNVDLVTSGTVAERRKARRAVAGFAKDAPDLTHLLNVLDLWPVSDQPDRALPPTPSWDGGRS